MSLVLKILANLPEILSIAKSIISLIEDVKESSTPNAVSLKNLKDAYHHAATVGDPAKLHVLLDKMCGK
jgi:hypothetical protein